MSDEHHFVALFAQSRTHVPEDRRDEIERALCDMVDAARAAWPDLTTSNDEFVRHLGQCLPEEAARGAELSKLHAADLYLACACAHGEKGAVEAFEKRYLAKTPAYLGRMTLAPSLVEEIRQLLSERLLVAPIGAAPRISRYAGRAALDGWIRVAAIRTALNRVRSDKKHQPLDEDTSDALAPNPDPELELVKQRYRGDFEASFRAAMGSLPPRDRNLLRLHFIDRLGIGEMATIHEVHRNTIARWLAGAQQSILGETRRLMRERLRLSPSELDSMMGIVQSRLEVTLTGLLRTTTEDSETGSTG